MSVDQDFQIIEVRLRKEQVDLLTYLAFLNNKKPDIADKTGSTTRSRSFILREIIDSSQEAQMMSEAKDFFKDGI